MKLLVFGSTRGTGKHVLEQALSAGHEVTAFVRNPDRLNGSADQVRVIVGDVMDAKAVAAAIPGHDAVLSMLGTSAFDSTKVRTVGTGNIVRGMEAAGVRRLISLSVLGVGDSRGNLPFHLKYLVIPLYLRKAFADHETQEICIQESDLDWTIVRPPHLTDGPPTGNYQHGFPATHREISLKVARADVAEFMLWQIDNASYVRQAAGISY